MLPAKVGNIYSSIWWSKEEKSLRGRINSSDLVYWYRAAQPWLDSISSKFESLEFAARYRQELSVKIKMQGEARRCSQVPDFRNCLPFRSSAPFTAYAMQPAFAVNTVSLGEKRNVLLHMGSLYTASGCSWISFSAEHVFHKLFSLISPVVRSRPDRFSCFASLNFFSI